MCLGSMFAVSSMWATVRGTLRMRPWAGAWSLLSRGAFEPAEIVQSTREGSIRDVTFVTMLARDLRTTRPVHRRAPICDVVPFLRI